LNVEQLTDEEQEELMDVIRICSDSMTRQAAEKDLVKETINKVSKELGIQKQIISKMVKVYFKRNYDEEVAIQEQFETLYTSVVK
jgi:uncharacterized membrane protein YjjP (DUF1212 family)